MLTLTLSGCGEYIIINLRYVTVIESVVQVVDHRTNVSMSDGVRVFHIRESVKEIKTLLDQK